MTKRLSSASAILCIAFLPATACSGVIRGVLHVPPPVRSSTMPGMYASQGNSMPGAHEVMRGLASDAVIYVDHVPPGADSALAASAPHPTLAQKNQSFEPRVLAIAVGTAVDFPNFDPIFHNAFSSFSGQVFDLGLYAPGTSRDVAFKRTGIVRVFCNIHPSMSAVIVVVRHPWFDVTKASGAFALDDVPPGEYTLHLFHERADSATLRALESRLVVEDADVTLRPVTISETGYLETPHLNKYGHDYPPESGDEGAYPGGR